VHRQSVALVHRQQLVVALVRRQQVLDSVHRQQLVVDLALQQQGPDSVHRRLVVASGRPQQESDSVFPLPVALAQRLPADSVLRRRVLPALAFLLPALPALLALALLLLELPALALLQRALLGLAPLQLVPPALARRLLELVSAPRLHRIHSCPNLFASAWTILSEPCVCESSTCADSCVTGSTCRARCECATRSRALQAAT
jgi:hypothetical protein